MKSDKRFKRCRPGQRVLLLGGLALALLLGLSEGAQAQWTTNGNNINNTNTGNVGIGTTAPASKLEVTGSTMIQRITNTDTTTYGVLGFFEGATELSHIGVVGSTSNPATYIGGPSAFQVWNAANAPIIFGTNSAERVRITGAGSVGIGTTSPVAKLEVNGTLYSAAAPTNTIFSGVVGTTNANFVGTSGYWALRTATNNSYNLDVYNSGAPLAALTVLQSGNVGIGTTAPLANLHVKGTHATVQFEPSSSSNYAYLNLGNGSSYGWQIGKDVDAGSFGGAGFYIYELTTGQQATRFAINKGGKVGIGTAVPGYKLDVQGGQMNASGGLCIAGDCKTAWSQVGGSSQWTTSGNNISNTNTGNVGIGTASPSDKLEVRSTTAGQAAISGTTTATSGTSYGMFAQATGANSGTNVGGYFTASGGTNNYGLLVATGNVGIGTSTPTHTLEVNGSINATGAITGGTINATYQDVAEWVPSSRKLSPGTVVVLDTKESNQVTASTQAYDTKVAGVVSAQPGVILGVAGENKAMVATTGRVKVKVDATRAPIKVGDLLVTSDVEGVAMKSEPLMIQGRAIHSPGTLIGKALEPLEKGTGEILVLLSLQ